MKTVDPKRIVEYINSCNCTVIAITEPINMTSVTSIQCSCKSVFFNSVKQIYGFQRRQSTINCGCISKKWTNENIDVATASRNIKRLTNCNIRGLQPSVTQVSWQCTKCDYVWRSRIDSVINKASGCPHCAGNIPYTTDTLNGKLLSRNRTDLVAVEIYNGSFKNKIRQQRHALFVCVHCNNNWTADIHNVIKFGYGCPQCNDNIGSRVEVDGLKFHSKLEYYFWYQYHEKQKPYVILRQQKYLPSRRFTCDYYIPEKRMWIEITGGSLLKRKKYSCTLEEKRIIILQKNEIFVTLTTFTEINKFIEHL